MQGADPLMLSLLPALMGAVVSIAVLHLWLWLGQRRDPLPLWVAAWCGITLLFLAGRLFQLTAETPTAAINGARLTWLAALSLFPVLMCLGHTLAGQRAARGVVVPVALFNAGLAVLVVTTELFVTGQVSLRRDVLAGAFLSPLPGPLTVAFAFYIVIVFAYVWFTSLRRLSASEERERRMVRGGFLLYVLLGINDVLYAARLLPTVRLFDFGFVAVAVGLSHLFIRRHNRLQAHLEDEVSERTRELEARRAELGALVGEGQQRERRLHTLTTLTQTLTATLSVDDLLDRVVRQAVELFGSSVARLWLLDESGQELQLRAHAGAASEVAGVTRLRVGEGVMGRIVATRAPLVIEDLAAYGAARNTERHRAEGVASFAGVPLLLGDRILGALGIAVREHRRFPEEDMRLLQSLANHAAIALENARLYEAEGAARREAELALAQVKQLQGMLPICAYCKKIRNDRNYWETIEGYIGERSEATFSHGICPECRDTVVAAQLEEYRRRRIPEP